MANFGVNIDEVWHQASLVQPPSGPSKHSPYTVPVQAPRNVMRESFENQSGGQRPPQTYSAADIPISSQEQMRVTAPPHPSQYSPPTPPSEIPRLKEQLTHQIDAVSDCQKEVFYLKALVQTLKRELQESDQRRQNQQRVDKKQKLASLIWMLFVGLFLIATVVILVQVSQKVNQLLSQPLLMGQ